MVTAATAGCVPRLRRRGRSVASSSASVCWTNVTPISLRSGLHRNAEIGRGSHRALAPAAACRRHRRCVTSCLRSPSTRDFELMRLAGARPPVRSLELVLAIQRESSCEPRFRRACRTADPPRAKSCGCSRGQPMDVHHQRHRRIAHGQAADLCRPRPGSAPWSPGETNSRSAMLSKPLEALSAGSRSVKSISFGRLSSASRSRIAF